jgi:hypothetical protein
MRGTEGVMSILVKEQWHVSIEAAGMKNQNANIIYQGYHRTGRSGISLMFKFYVDHYQNKNIL